MLPRSLVLLNIGAEKEGLDGYRISDQTAADEEQPDAGRTGQPLRINQGFPVAAGTESDLAFDRDAAGYRRSAGDDAGEVFPGRTRVSDEDIIFYRTLAPYNPALVMISEVKSGEIYQFDSDFRGNWRVATKFTYRRIRTS